jgi:hypothetical protein
VSDCAGVSRFGFQSSLHLAEMLRARYARFAACCADAAAKTRTPLPSQPRNRETLYGMLKVTVIVFARSTFRSRSPISLVQSETDRRKRTCGIDLGLFRTPVPPDKDGSTLCQQ